MCRFFNKQIDYLIAEHIVCAHNNQSYLTEAGEKEEEEEKFNGKFTMNRICSKTLR